MYDEIAGKNPDFQKMYTSLRDFQSEEYLWFQVAEYSFDNFMIRSRAGVGTSIRVLHGPARLGGLV